MNPNSLAQFFDAVCARQKQKKTLAEDVLGDAKVSRALALDDPGYLFAE